MADKKISALPAATTPLAGTEVLPIVQGGTTDQVSVANLTAGRDISTKAITTTGNVGVKCTPLSITPLQVSLGTDRRLSTFLNGSDNVLGFLTDAGNWTGSFYTGNPAVFGNAGAEAFRIDTNQNIVIKTAGKGIDFSANTHAAGMTSEVLTWYEEGNWTPTYTGWSSNPVLVSATYTRIGRIVHLNALLFSGVNAGGASIGGLPYASGNAVGGAAISAWTYDNPSVQLNGVIINNASSITNINAIALGSIYWTLSTSYVVG